MNIKFLDHVKVKQAYYLAEAGLEEGLYSFSVNLPRRLISWKT